MRTFLLFLVIALMTGAAGSMAYACSQNKDTICMPQPGSDCNECLCPHIGVTMLNGNQKSLIACLLADDGYVRWTVMAGGNEDDSGKSCDPQNVSWSCANGSGSGCVGTDVIKTSPCTASITPNSGLAIVGALGTDGNQDGAIYQCQDGTWKLIYKTCFFDPGH